MAPYRKKPIEIDAEQWFKGKEVDGVVWKALTIKRMFIDDEVVSKPVIETLEGDMQVSDGDWIITGVNGEKYPCKPDIFEKTYEEI